MKLWWSPEEFERATRVTYLGAVWGTRSALRRMLPAAVALLRRQTGDQGLPAVAARRASPQAVECARDDGAAPRCEHPAVRALPLEDVRARDAGPADLQAGGSCRRRPLGRSPSPTRGVCRRAD